MINYPDDFFFAALNNLLCNNQVRCFLGIYETIGVPVALEKTEWGANFIIFLGLLIDAKNRRVSIPVGKINKARDQIRQILKCKKVKMHMIQRLCGFLNFLCRAIILGRAFMRRLYSFTANLKPHYHIRVTKEMKLDLEIWDLFLNHPSVFSRPFMDYQQWHADKLTFYTNTARNFTLGFGGIFEDQ